MNTLTALQIYELPFERESCDLQMLRGVYFDHVPELNATTAELADCDQDRVCIRVHGYRAFDDRRYWLLASVWFNDYPVMVIQNAGREGDDYSARWVTDEGMYRKMVDWLHCILVLPIRVDIVPLDATIPTNFYGYSLEEATSRV